MRFSIKTVIYSFGAVMALGLLIAVAASLWATHQIRVGGPTYTKIVQGKDLVADILPPPAYIIESYLEATLALNNAKPIAESTAALQELKKQYEERYKYWLESDLADSMKIKMTKDSHDHVLAFWSALEGQLLPALQRADQTAAAQAYAAVTKSYAGHRAVIDQVVKLAEVGNSETESASQQQGFMALAWVLSLVAGLFVIIAAGMIAINRWVVRPLNNLTGVMRQLAAGDLSVVVPSQDRSDEVGHMARALVVFRDAAVENLELENAANERRVQSESDQRQHADAQARAAEEQAQVVRALADGLGKLSDGDLTYRLSEGFTNAYVQIRDDYNAAISQLHETIGAIAAATREVSNTAAEISSSTTDLSQRTEQQTASLEQTSASMEQISVTVKNNAGNARDANRFAGNARDVADRGGEVVKQAVTAVAQIEESSHKISDIIGVIDEIARQTNLLALNAAVEAARAGEAGRGFAVVASEVRSLAQRSSQAAKDIKQLISSSTSQVQAGVELVNRAGASLADILQSIKQVVDVASNISTASEEQSTGIDQVNAALVRMDEVTQQNSALVEQNAAAARALEQQSRAMDERVGFFRLEAQAAAAMHSRAGKPVTASKARRAAA
ncbi:MAG: HAMP domain-containing protein [Xanthobacteraceae bacterium]|nr:HAMP domain-containing protein [Xanthobacteraceae bacterium]